MLVAYRGRTAAVLAGTGLLALLSIAFWASPASSEPVEAGLVPRLPDLSDIVVDEEWALVLGKALFWDEQIGSDGVACASCHFHAGADVRITNGLSPGLLELPEPDLGFGATAPQGELGRTASGGIAGPNYTMVPEDFPFHQLADPDDRNSEILITTNDRLSSSGAFPARFDARPGGPKAPGGGPRPDRCEVEPHDSFQIDGLATRQVEPRHTPSTINAVFYHRNFWDGRAANSFNGVNPFGTAAHVDPTAGVIVHEGKAKGGGGGSFRIEYLDLPDASLASQASGPPLSVVEMSCSGRGFPDLGRRILRYNRRPLEHQEIHPEDSVLGASGPKGDVRGGKGLKLTYNELIQRAFHPRYWGGPSHDLIKAEDGSVVHGRGDGHTQMEHNFAMFFSIAVMLYEATLVSDQSRFDAAEPCISDPDCDPVEEGLLTELEMDGRTLFNGFGRAGGRCVACHGGALFSAAASAAHEDPVLLVGRGFEDDGNGGEVATLFDDGFFNLGLRPVHEDPGVGGTDDYGNPLSLARRYKTWRYYNKDEGYWPGFTFDPCDLERAFEDPFDPDDCSWEPLGPEVALEAVKVDGAFKTPTLRNVALTPPYFHYGGYRSLEEVVKFYAHGGNRRERSLADPQLRGDDSGTGPLGEGGVPYSGPDSWTNVEDNVRTLNLALGGDKDQQYGIDALVAFMKTLTDRRVQCDMAPFDHPSLRLFVAHEPQDSNGDGRADDVVFTLPAVGASGYTPESGLCIPNAGDLFAPGMQARVGGEPSDPAEFRDPSEVQQVQQAVEVPPRRRVRPGRLMR